MSGTDENRAGQEAALMFWLQRAHRAVRKQVLQRFADRGYALTADHWTVFSEIARARGATAAEIATATGRDRPTVSRLLDALEDMGVVSRTHEGRRGRRARLTSRGRSMYQATGRIFLELMQALPSELRARDLDTARQVLQALAEAFDPDAGHPTADAGAAAAAWAGDPPPE